MYFHLTHSLWLISPETLLKGWCPAHLPSGVFHRAPVELLRAVQTPGSILTTVPEWLRPTLCFHSRRRYETLDVLLKSTSVRSHQSKAFSWFWTVFILYLCTLWSALLSVFWLAGTRLGILELKKKWSQKISSFHKSLGSIEERWWRIRTYWQDCVDCLLHGLSTSPWASVVTMTEDKPCLQRPRRRYHNACYALDLLLPNFQYCPPAFIKGWVLSSRGDRSQSPFLHECEDLMEGMPPHLFCLPPSSSWSCQCPGHCSYITVAGVTIIPYFFTDHMRLKA